MAFEKIRGTYDLLPEDSLFFYKLKKDIEKIFELSGFYYVESAILQPVEIFKRSIGSESDIVKKEMFEVVSNSQSIVLKAEETAPLMAGLSEKKFWNLQYSLNFSYFTKVFRHRETSKGRFREFYQYGCESIGDFNKFMDGEVIELGKGF